MPPEIEDGSQAIVDELEEINLATTEDLKPIFVSVVLNDEEMAQYEQLFQAYKDVFTWGYQDMPGWIQMSLSISWSFLKVSSQ